MSLGNSLHVAVGTGPQCTLSLGFSVPLTSELRVDGQKAKASVACF